LVFFYPYCLLGTLSLERKITLQENKTEKYQVGLVDELKRSWAM